MLRSLILFAFLCGSLTSALRAQESRDIPLVFFRASEGVPIRRPLFGDEGKKSWKLKTLFSQSPVDPRQFDLTSFESISTLRQTSVPWSIVQADAEDQLTLARPKLRDSDAAFIAYAVTLVGVEKFAKPKLVIKSRDALRVWQDDQIVGTKSSIQSDDDEPGSLEIELTLERGRYGLVFEGLRDQHRRGPITFKATLTTKLSEEEITTGLDLPPRWNLHHHFDVQHHTSASIAKGGRFIAMNMKRSHPDGDKSESWIAICDLASGETIHEIRGARDFQWSDNEDEYHYIATRGEKGVIRLGQVKGGEVDASAPIEDLEYARRLLPGFVIVTKHHDDPKRKRDVQLLRGLSDRDPDSRTSRRISWIRECGPALFDRRDNNRDLVVGGAGEIRIADLREDIGGKGPFLLIAKADRTQATSPYLCNELWEYDLGAGTSHKLTSATWFRGASYSPDGASLLITAGVSAFGDLGRDPDLAPDCVPNDYDIEIYRFDRVSKKVTPLSQNFDPSIRRAHWSPYDHQIHALVNEGTRQTLYRLDPKTEQWSPNPVERRLGARRPVEMVIGFDLDETSGRLLIRGEGCRRPPVLAVFEPTGETIFRDETLKKGGDDPSDRHTLTLPYVSTYNVTLEDGTVIDGRVHLPRDYESRNRYPAIVYYYAGVNPSLREFGGRYPKEYWAEQGYLVYVLTPSGSTGYGQKRSARHVNDWGERTAQEIIACTERFLDDWPVADRDSVGCIGASYGGFSTMDLMTKTKLFKTGISHAGISSIASYWGEGHWGYAYGSVALSQSYPWSRPDIFVERSALFRADRFEGSLLLVHGNDDTNVPRGQSDQMYTALKILGKPVNYLRFDHENHHILGHERRRLWTKSLAAWFDRELKLQPEWWDHLYGEDRDH